MKIIVCLDDSKGMMFNKRRLSRDIVLTERIARITEGSRLLAAPYSEDILAEVRELEPVYSDDFLDLASEPDFCFVENCGLANCAESIDEIIVFYWNRRYPSDLKFDLNLEDGNWKVESETDFKGNSHDKITEIKYVRIK